MGISEKIEKLADKKERERSHTDIEKLINNLESLNVAGLDEILSEIIDLEKSGFYRDIINAFKIEAYSRGIRTFTEDELLHVRIIRLAKENLRIGGLFTTLFTQSLIAVRTVIMIYLIIKYTYHTNINNPINWNDTLNIYFSGLDERIIFALDKFDEVELEYLPEPTPEYFQMLKKVRWGNKKAKKPMTN